MLPNMLALLLAALLVLDGCGKSEEEADGPPPGSPAPAVGAGNAAEGNTAPDGRQSMAAPVGGGEPERGTGTGTEEGTGTETATGTGTETATGTGTETATGTGEVQEGAENPAGGTGTGPGTEKGTEAGTGTEEGTEKEGRYEPPRFAGIEETRWDRRRRAQMVEFLRDRYRHRIRDERVLVAMGAVPRHEYMLPEDRDNGYKQMWYRIGHGQTITDPGMVAYMTMLINVRPEDKVLEIGTGSGYQASVLAQLTPKVYTIEIVERLAKRTHAMLDRIGYGETVIRRKIDDGYRGWEEEAPFDKIIVTCAADHVPPPLLQQLEPGGLMVIPVGPRYQPGKLHFIAKDEAGQVHQKVLATVEFVPLNRKRKEKESRTEENNVK